jgi:hypothetical protein
MDDLAKVREREMLALLWKTEGRAGKRSEG